MENFLKEDAIETSLTKLESLISMEKKDLDDIKNYFNNVHYYYKSNNKSKIEELNSQFINKFKTIVNMHDNNLIVIKRNLQNYKDTKIKVENIFNDII